MPEYRRAIVPGGTFFFTVITFNRQPIFNSEPAREQFKHSYSLIKQILPFETIGFVLLPNHLHCIWTLPPGDTDYSKRWGLIKRNFTKNWKQLTETTHQQTSSQIERNEGGIWQRRFCEHTIRDNHDLQNHLNYIHYNPIKHGYVECAHEWQWSTFQRFVEQGFYKQEWCCQCSGRKLIKPKFHGLRTDFME